MIFRTDRQEAAFAAAMGCFNAMHRAPTFPTLYDAIQIRLLAEDIYPYSHTFTIRQTASASFQIIASDEGCVNQGNVLAECWIEYDSAHDAFLFTWES